MTEASEMIAGVTDTRLVWRHGHLFPGGVSAFARTEKREPHVPILTDGAVDDFAIVLHEIGHCLTDAHQGADHINEAVNKDDKNWLRCLACEAGAWEMALRIAPTCLLEAVHAQAVESLARYTDSTPGTREAFRRVERVRGRIAFLLEKHNRVMEDTWR